jgi:hypothetical protein
MDNNEYSSRALKLDTTAASADSSLPAFLSRPDDAPVYHGFPLVPETETDGWYYGAITEFEDSDGCESGDGYVLAPDGSRAGIVWNVGQRDLETVCAPDESRWGVYEVWFPRAVKTVDDLVSNFRSVLPALKSKYLEIKSQS